MITVALCRVVETIGEEDTLQPLHRFASKPVPTGTVFRWRGTLYTHAYDLNDTIVYVEQRIIDAP